MQPLKAPPLLLGLTLALWGYQTGMVWVAVPLVVLLELAFVWPQRWQVERTDYYRIWDFCVILFVASALYCFVSRDTTNDVMEFFQVANFSKRNQVMNNVFATAFIFFEWMPVVFFPMALVQAYAVDSKIAYSTFSWIWRRQFKQGTHPERGYLNFSYPYFAMILFSTSLVNERDPIFFIGLSALILFALAAIRPRRFSPLIWAPLAVMVISLGYGGQIGLQRLQGEVENNFAQWLSKMLNRGVNPYESRTAIGRLGRLKLSGKVVMRVETDGHPVGLLRESSYDVFMSPSWFLSKNTFHDVISESDATTWKLIPEKKKESKVYISTYFPRGRALVALPTGTVMVEKLLSEGMQTNFYGATAISNGVAFARYEATYGPGATIDSDPDNGDLMVPDQEQYGVKKIVAEMGLKQTDPLKKKLATIMGFFEQNFRYSTWQGPQKVKGKLSPVGYFLTHSRAGHCEYFASATVLILRELGVKARYAVGFSVQESQGGPNKYVVRERHGHAWTLYYDDQEKAWKDYDTTPPDWLNTEEKNASLLEPLNDMWSRFRYQISEWRWLTDRAKLRNYMIWTLIIVISFLGWRLFRRNRLKRVADGVGKLGSNVIWPGSDSEFYQVENKLSAMGLNRLPGESLRRWLVRIGNIRPELVKELPHLVRLHYRYRFDPSGLSAGERQELRDGVSQWLAMGRTLKAEPQS